MKRYASVSAYLRDQPKDVRAALEKLRSTILAAAPHATETISYGMPAFKDGDRVLVYYAAFKDHYSLFPASKGVLETMREELAPYVAGKGTLRFEYSKRLPVTLIKKVVKIRLKENAARRR